MYNNVRLMYMKQVYDLKMTSNNTKGFIFQRVVFYTVKDYIHVTLQY